MLINIFYIHRFTNQLYTCVPFAFFCVVYGLTEVSGSFTTIPVTEKAQTRKPTSVGPPFVNVEMKVYANSYHTMTIINLLVSIEHVMLIEK